MRKNVINKQVSISPIEAGYRFPTVESKKRACEFATLNGNRKSHPEL